MESCKALKLKRKKSFESRYGDCAGEGVRHAAYLESLQQEHGAAQEELERARRAEKGSLALADDSRHQMKSLRSQLNDEWRTVVERLTSLCHEFGATDFRPSGKWTDAADCLELTLLQMRDRVDMAEQSHGDQERVVGELTDQLQQLVADDVASRAAFDKIGVLMGRLGAAADAPIESSPAQTVEWLERRLEALQQELAECHTARQETDELIGELTAEFRSTAEQVRHNAVGW